MSKTLLLIPRISEKTYGLSQARNVYTFAVPASSNKTEVTRAVTDQFDVTVLSVNIINSKGKPKRTVRKGARPVDSKRSDVKKAYVALKEGDSIPTIFASDEPAEEPKRGKK